jgi:hypothetical protein
MSALPLKADMCGATQDVRFGPIADIETNLVCQLFDHLIGAGEQRLRHSRLITVSYPVGHAAAVPTKKSHLIVRHVDLTIGQND